MLFPRLEWIRSVLLVLAVVAVSPPAIALTMSEEIDQLLSIIATSPCAFIRNGAAYDGAQAAEHIRKKYEHYRSDIRSTEDFIALAATRSALSGRPYAVQCDADVMPAADWLTKELAALRRRS